MRNSDNCLLYFLACAIHIILTLLLTIHPFYLYSFQSHARVFLYILSSHSSLRRSAVGVLGGSVSSCHGLDATTAHPLGNPIGPNCYPHRVFGWLNDVFPHPANELTNGARESDFRHG